MGTPKQLLDIDGRPMLAAVVESIAAAGADGTTVVTNTDVAGALHGRLPPGVRVLVNDDEHSAMIDSIRLGLDALKPLAGLPDGVLVCPGDHPGIATADFKACIAAYRGAPGRIVVATRGGQRGHPIIFPMELEEIVQSAACDAGLHALPRLHAARVIEVACDSPGITADVDTPEDYQRHPGENPA